MVALFSCILIVFDFQRKGPAMVRSTVAIDVVGKKPITRIWFQWWKGPSGRSFTTLHPNFAAGVRFRRSRTSAKKRGRWNSHLDSTLRWEEVSKVNYNKILVRLKGRDGIRAYITDFVGWKFI
jgi:hypothetical protein